MKYIVLLTALLICSQSFGQDIIYKKDGDKIEAKVLSVSATEVVYKKFQNLEGPDYILNVTKISTIVYQNGDHEVFDVYEIDYVRSYRKNRVRIDISYGSNILAMNYIDLLFGRLSLSYEHISDDGKVSVRIPMAVSFGDTENVDFLSYTHFKTGLDIHFYPGRQGRIRYLIGPSLRVRQESEINFSWPGPDLPGEKFASLGAYVNNGVLFQISQKFNISLILGIGVKNYQDSFSNTTDKYTGVHAFFEGNMGIRF